MLHMYVGWTLGLCVNMLRFISTSCRSWVCLLLSVQINHGETRKHRLMLHMYVGWTLDICVYMLRFTSISTVETIFISQLINSFQFLKTLLTWLKPRFASSVSQLQLPQLRHPNDDLPSSVPTPTFDSRLKYHKRHWLLLSPALSSVHCFYCCLLIATLQCHKTKNISGPLFYISVTAISYTRI